VEHPLDLLAGHLWSPVGSVGYRRVLLSPKPEQRQSQSSGSIQQAQQAVSLDPRLRVYQLNVARLAGEDVQAVVGDEVNLEEWSLTNYGRLWR